MAKLTGVRCERGSRDGRRRRRGGRRRPRAREPDGGDGAARCGGKRRLAATGAAAARRRGGRTVRERRRARERVIAKRKRERRRRGCFIWTRGVDRGRDGRDFASRRGEVEVEREAGFKIRILAISGARVSGEGVEGRGKGGRTRGVADVARGRRAREVARRRLRTAGGRRLGMGPTGGPHLSVTPGERGGGAG
uniref:Uncharacterized protein n=1 Tax=Oryza sativa subsp. japonica TaxID=39947 RepID=Q6YZT1_ORYSJ|nr:hypothetical protein [Oryza sativa Japonica Group]